jgi:hypothetical protein
LAEAMAGLEQRAMAALAEGPARESP